MEIIPVLVWDNLLVGSSRSWISLEFFPLGQPDEVVPKRSTLKMTPVSKRKTSYLLDRIGLGIFSKFSHLGDLTRSILTGQLRKSLQNQGA